MASLYVGGSGGWTSSPGAAMELTLLVLLISIKVHHLKHTSSKQELSLDVLI